MDLRVGGKYRIGKKIGSGSFGESLFSLWCGREGLRTTAASRANGPGGATCHLSLLVLVSAQLAQQL